ncbi:MAG TPA: ABC-F family ATP-binding cassette domain-containing protein [Candidatus Caccovivens faecavium]|nr:ABC-F family ATP-binding cassette domain-containing protein [Candidatus Caccovivens faecavium]
MRGQHLCLAFGNEVIYDDAEFNLNDLDKTGIVGVNGAGKTTLFKVILKQQELDRGYINTGSARIGYLPQEIDFSDRQKSVWDYLFDARPIRKIEAELNEIYDKLATANEEEQIVLLRRMGTLQAQLDEFDAYNVENILLQLIDDMKIGELLDMKLEDLSGGQKSKIAFAHLLFSNPQILLLDEPTNHLDATTKEFVTNYLKNYKGSVLIISHDIDFLNAIVNKILFVNKVTHKISVYNGDYAMFKRKYAQEQLLKELRIKEQEQEIKRLSDFVQKARQASQTNHNIKRMGKDREIKLAKAIASLEKRDKEYKHVKIQLEPKRMGGKVPLEVSNLTFHYSNKANLYEKLSFSLSQGERFLIVGENGVGKSTLLKLIMGILQPISGEIKFNPKTDVGYYAQELEILDESKTVFESTENSDLNDLQRHGILANFLFQGDTVMKKVEVLSPGEKARVALCKLLLEKPNLLILDEPTNHLDPDTQAIIGENFKDYTGTILLASHNPEFVEQIGITRMLILPDGKIVDYSKELLDYYYILNTDFI